MFMVQMSVKLLLMSCILLWRKIVRLDSIIQGTISFVGSDRNNLFAKLESIREISEVFLSITLRKNITTHMKKCFLLSLV